MGWAGIQENMAFKVCVTSISCGIVLNDNELKSESSDEAVMWISNLSHSDFFLILQIVVFCSILVLCHGYGHGGGGSGGGHGGGGGGGGHGGGGGGGGHGGGGGGHGGGGGGGGHGGGGGGGHGGSSYANTHLDAHGGGHGGGGGKDDGHDYYVSNVRSRKYIFLAVSQKSIGAQIRLCSN